MFNRLIGALVFWVAATSVYADMRPLPFRIEFVGDNPSVQTSTYPFGLKLPLVVKHQLESAYYQYRLPTSEDFVGNWQAIGLDNFAKPKSIPFCVISDFNEDKKDDLALILLPKVSTMTAIVIALIKIPGEPYTDFVLKKLDEGTDPRNWYVTKEYYDVNVGYHNYKELVCVGIQSITTLPEIFCRENENWVTYQLNAE